jgi:hypothetical protein
MEVELLEKTAIGIVDAQWAYRYHLVTSDMPWSWDFSRYPENWSDLGDGQFALASHGDDEAPVYVEFSGDTIVIADGYGVPRRITVAAFEGYRQVREQSPATAVQIVRAPN